MPYLTSWERIAKKEGKREGKIEVKIEGKLELAKEFLKNGRDAKFCVSTILFFN